MAVKPVANLELKHITGNYGWCTSGEQAKKGQYCTDRYSLGIIQSTHAALFSMHSSCIMLQNQK